MVISYYLKMIRKTISDQLKNEYIDANGWLPTTKTRLGVTPDALCFIFNAL